MHEMFSGCESLSYINLSNFKAKNVTNMSGLFSGCKNLIFVKLSNFNTEKVKDMSWMFSECRSLTFLDVSSFNTENVENMRGMFYGCSSLLSLYLSNFNTQNVTNMHKIFFGCQSLTSIDLSSFNDEQLTDMSNIFYQCKSLTSIKLSNSKTLNVSEIDSMLTSCDSLKPQDLFLTDGISCLSFNKDFTKVALSKKDNVIYIYSIPNLMKTDTWKLEDKLEEHLLYVSGIDWNWNTNQIISSSGSTNTCRIATGDVANTYFAVGDQVAIFPTASEDWSTAELRTLTAFSVQETYIEFTFDGSPINLTEGVSRIFGVMQKNGRCDAINKTGMLASGNTHTRPFVYRGIENLYGNLGEFVDGITYDFTNKRLCIGSEYLTFETPINSNYIDSPNPGYIYSMGVDPNKPTVTMPKTLSVNPTSGYCDEWSTFGSGLAGDVVYGCAWDHMGGNGLFCFRALTAGTNNRLYTGRAML